MGLDMVTLKVLVIEAVPRKVIQVEVTAVKLRLEVRNINDSNVSINSEIMPPQRVTNNIFRNFRWLPGRFLWSSILYSNRSSHQQKQHRKPALSH